MGGRFSILMVILLVSANAALAQSSAKIFGFGDSYADTNDPNDPGGILPKGLPFPSNMPIGRFSNGENFVDRLQRNFGISSEDSINYAFGGALTNTTNIGNFFDPPDPRQTGFLSQISLASDEVFSSEDIIALSIGGNNMLAALLDLPIAADGPTEFALRSAAEAASGVQALVDQGARTIAVIPSGGDPAFFPIGVGIPGLQNARDFALQYATALQSELAPIAAQGIRVNFFDYAEFQHRLFGDGQPFSGELARFGFLDAAAQGLPDAASVPCLASPFNPVECDPATAGTFFYWDAVHLTEAGYNLMADFMTIQLVQNETIPVQAELAQIQSQNFTEILHQRMQARRSGATGFEIGYSARNGVDPRRRSYKDFRPGAPVDDEFALFVSGGVGGGDRDARDGIVGYDYDLSHITAGMEWKANEHFYLGTALNYTNTQSDYAFLRGTGGTELESINMGVYGSIAYPNWFADLALGSSINSYNMSRTGFVSPFGEAIGLDTSGKTDGDSFAADFRTGFLIHTGTLSFGPIVGLSYTRVTVDGYTESGDSLLTMNVEGQELDSLIGSIGAQASYNISGIEPYVAVTMEREFKEDFSYDFALTSADLVVNSVTVGNNNDQFGRVRAGIRAQLSDQLSASVDGNATLDRDGGDDYAVTGAIKYRF